MSTRIEFLKNGQRICVSGINGDGVLSVGLSYVKHSGEDHTHELFIGGLGMFAASLERDHHVRWPSPEVTTGDEITLRILPPGEFDDRLEWPAALRRRLRFQNGAN